MRAGRLIAEVNAEELVMTTREASGLLAGCGLALQPNALKRLMEETEGWPVGLYLASLSLAMNGEAELPSGSRSG